MDTDATDDVKYIAVELENNDMAPQNSSTVENDTEKIMEDKGVQKQVDITEKPAEKTTLRDAFKKTLLVGIIGEIVVIIMMFAISNLVYGTAWNTIPYTRKYMTIAIWLPSSSSNGLIESSVNNVVENHISYELYYDFKILSSDEISLHELRNDVDYGHYYGAFAVMEGASDQLEQYLSGASSDRPSCVYYYDQARAGPSFQFALRSLGSKLMVYSNLYLTESILYQISSSPPTIVVDSVGKVVQPVSVDIDNLHPVDRFGLFIVSGTGSLQMYLVMLCHSLGLAPLTASLRGHGIKKYQLIQLSAFHRIFGALYLSVYPMIITLILGSSNSHIIHSPATFFITWAFTWLTFSIFGGIVYHLVNILGLGVAVVISIIFLNFMQSTSATSVPLAASPLFYSLGYGFPFFNVALGFKYIWFYSQPNMFSQAIGILIIWWAEMFLSVQIEVFGVMQAILSFMKRRLHLYPDSHDIEAKEREYSRKMSRVSAKHAEMVESIQSRRSAMSRSRSSTVGAAENNGTSSDYQALAIDALAIQTSENKSLDLSQTDLHAADIGQSNLQSSSEANNSPSIGYVKVDISDKYHFDGKYDENKDYEEELPNIETIIQEDDQVDHDQTSIFDPSVRPVIVQYIRQSIAFEIALTIIFIVLMFFTYGAAWNPFHYHYRIRIAILNQEGNKLTSPFTTALNIATHLDALTTQYGFTFDHLPYDEVSYNDLKDKVDNRDYFAAFIVQKNATEYLSEQLTSSSGSTSSNPLAFIYNGARGGSYINNYLRLWAGQMQVTMNAIISEEILAMTSGNISQYNINSLAMPAGMTEVNLHPFPKNAPGSDAAISVAATAMYLGMIAHCFIVKKSHDPLTNLGLSYPFRIMLQGLHILLGSFLLSFAPAISMIWYGFKMSGNQFFSFWAMLWIGMCSFGSYIMTNYHLFGFSFGGVVNILIFALNTTSNTASLPIELLPTFFRIGYGLPAAQFVIGSRYILFGSDRPGFLRGIGVLFAWIFVVFFGSLTLIYRQHKLKHMSDIAKAASLRALPSLRAVFHVDNDDEQQKLKDTDDKPVTADYKGTDEQGTQSRRWFGSGKGDSMKRPSIHAISNNPRASRMSHYENYHLNTEFNENVEPRDSFRMNASKHSDG